MAGYIGSKAVNLSTTGADINGDANIDGDLSFRDNDKIKLGAGSDLQIHHNGTNSIITDSGTGGLILRSNLLSLQNAAGTETLASFVEDGAVTIRYDNVTKLTTTSTGVSIVGAFAATDGSTITVDDNSVALDLICTDTDAVQGPILRLSRDVVGAASDVIGTFQYYGQDVAGNETHYAEIEGRIEDATDGAEDGTLVLSTMVAGSSRARLNFYSTEAVFNDGSQDINFRVESNGNANMLFVDGGNDRVGIGHATPDGLLHLKNTDSTAYSATATDGQVGVGPTIYLENPANSNTTVGGQIVFGMRSTEEQARIGATGGTAPALTFGTGDAEAMRIDSSGHLQLSGSTDNVIRSGLDSSRVRIFGGGTESVGNGAALTLQGVNHLGGNYADLASGTGGYINFRIGTSNAMRIDSSGNLLVGTTDKNIRDSSSAEGMVYRNGDSLDINRSAAPPLIVNRVGNSDGDLVLWRKDGTTVGAIATLSSQLYIGSSATSDAYLRFGNSVVRPCASNGVNRDNAIDLGAAGARFDDIYATNGTIQTSDRNEKQDIEELSDAEQRVAVACKGLLRKFRWRDAVEAKGDEARTHFGIIAQDLQAAFSAEGLDAGDYAMFISSTWWEATETFTDEETGEEKTRTDTYETQEEAPEGATERTRLGVRYSELLAFIIGAL